jgi:hypothetical protein
MSSTMAGDENKLQRAVDFHTRGESAQAAALYAEILGSQPKHPDALHLLGVCGTQLGDAQTGLTWIAKSLTINPHQPVALANQGNAQLALKRPADARTSPSRSSRCAIPLRNSSSAPGGSPRWNTRAGGPFDRVSVTSTSGFGWRMCPPMFDVWIRLLHAAPGSRGESAPRGHGERRGCLAFGVCGIATLP